VPRVFDAVELDQTAGQLQTPFDLPVVATQCPAIKADGGLELAGVEFSASDCGQLATVGCIRIDPGADYSFRVGKYFIGKFLVLFHCGTHLRELLQAGVILAGKRPGPIGPVQFEVYIDLKH
jgi:hypothetical protein